MFLENSPQGNFLKKLVIAVLLMASISVSQAQVDERTIPVDTLIDWSAPLPMEGEHFSRYFRSHTFVQYSMMSQIPMSDGNVRYEARLASSEANVKMTFLNRFKVRRATAFASPEDVVYKIELIVPQSGDPALFRLEFEEALSEVVKCESQSAGKMRMPNGDLFAIHRWPTPAVQVTTCEEPDKSLWVEILNPAHYGKGRYANAIVAARQTTHSNYVEVDLDPLLALEKIWSCSVADFEKTYRAKTKEPQELPPHFEWLDAAKTRARFSRKLDPKLETKITAFAKSIKVDEAIVEFVNGKAARATVIFYNRGDSGNIAAADFNNLFKKIGQNLGQVIKVAPTNQSAVASAAVKTVSWQWQSPTGIALLEHNEFASGGLVGQPEFLRLKLAAPDQADWSMGKLAVGVQKMALLKNITKNSNGDVFISGVPMVDQGAKGYCVAASCQRLFEYMRIPCDQHQIAQLVNVDAESGANIFGMQKSLAKIDGQFKVSFKPFINPELYYSGYGKRRVSQRQFSITVKEHVDKGVPLLWALELGRFPEDPPLPNGGQVSGGHMRLVIGYNPVKKEILFTDSWGAGHELKRMTEDAAYEVTLGLYSMSPRGL